jgi:hypothetical protein
MLKILTDNERIKKSYLGKVSPKFKRRGRGVIFEFNGALRSQRATSLHSVDRIRKLILLNLRNLRKSARENLAA